jgi:2-keto-3-deoxy-L-rhamnonate aldolase RhmA
VNSSFRQRVAAGRLTAGTFVKTAAHEVVELLGHVGLDFVVLDAEHAPLGIETLDRMVLGARSANLPCLVRLLALHPGLAGQVLDLGADGIVAPHVRDAESARMAVAETRYHGGRRGYSPSTRAGHYGRLPVAEHAAESASGISVWCQVEDAEALDHLDAIAAVDGVDVLFVGRADLTISLGASGPSDQRVAQAVREIANAGARHGKSVGIYVATMAEAGALMNEGISVFACGSDQSHLAAAGASIMQARLALENNVHATEAP